MSGGRKSARTTSRRLPLSFERTTSVLELRHSVGLSATPESAQKPAIQSASITLPTAARPTPGSPLPSPALSSPTLPSTPSSACPPADSLTQETVSQAVATIKAPHNLSIFQVSKNLALNRQCRFDGRRVWLPANSRRSLFSDSSRFGEKDR